MRTPLLVLVIGMAMPAQTVDVFIPDDNPAVGPCTTPPLTVADATVEWVIPAASLGTTPGLIEEISLAPCATATFSAPDFKAVIGHLPTGFLGGAPVISDGTVAETAGFSEPAVPHDSDLDGGWSFQLTQDQWSPLGFASKLHGTGFVWDGVRDVGLMITWLGAVGGVPLHTAPGNPSMTYTPLYQGLLNPTFYSGGRMRVTIRPLPAAPSIQNFGLPCPFLTFEPTIHTTNFPFVGQQRLSVTIQMHFGTGPATLYFATTAGATWTVGTAPYICSAYLDQASAAAFLAQGFGPFPAEPHTMSTSRWRFSIPNDPSLAGLSLAMQATRQTVFGAETSNALVFTIN